MEVIIKNNDAFHVLSVSTSISPKQLQNKIIWGLQNEGIIACDDEDCGKTVQELADLNNYTIHEIIEILFPEQIENQEVPELLKSIYIWGIDGGCPDCGCELNVEEDSGDGHTWENKECSNNECEYATSGEPDWDVLPGGKDYY